MNNTERLDLVKQAGPWSEYFGRGTSAILPALLGAGAGAGIGGSIGGSSVAVPGALYGGAASASIGPAIAGLAALITNTRTKKEQEEEDNNSSALKNLLVPGYAQYQHYKRKGYLADSVGHPLSDQ